MIETVCGGVVVVGSLLLTQVFTFSPVLPSMRSFGGSTQNLLFLSVPLTIYVTSRLYFTGAMVGMDKALEKLPKKWSNLFWRIMAFVVMYVGVQISKLLFPGIADIAWDAYLKTMGQLPTMVMDHTKAEREKFFERGQKFFWLITAWFAFFFVFELILRALMFGLGRLLKATLYKGIRTTKELTEPSIDSGDESGGEERSDNGDKEGVDN